MCALGDGTPCLDHRHLYCARCASSRSESPLARNSSRQAGTMPLLSVNGIDLYYEEAGDGLPLLLISGAGGKTVDWTPLLPALSERFRVVAFDNRGGGRSSAPPGPYTTRQMADDATALLDHLAITRAHVVGLSLGGMIAQELALAAPARVDRLVLLATY